MHQTLARLISVVSFCMLLSACGKTIMLSNYPNNPFPAGMAKGIPLDKIEKAISSAAVSKGWVTEKQSDNKILATLNIRKHKLVVEISFDERQYTINYKSSENLLYDGKRIHRQYANWLKNLRYAINARLMEL